MLAVGVILVILVVGYVHFLWGFFSAGLSAIMATIAALVALGWHEQVVAALLGGKMADSANAMVICGLFALTYTVLRVLSDWFLSGNLRFPFIVDKIGAGIMGVFTGMMATGVIVVAAQTLPFGPSIAGYSRFPTEEASLTLPALKLGKQQTNASYDKVDPTVMSTPDNRPQRLAIPVDDFVLGLLRKTNTGSLSTSTIFANIHPNYLLELFGQRIGYEPEARHVVAGSGAKLLGVWGAARLRSLDAELTWLRFKNADTLPIPTIEGESLSARVLRYMKAVPPHPPTIPQPSRYLIVRISLSPEDGDKDSHVRFSTASVRLVINGQNYFAAGTMEGAVMAESDPDDILIAHSGVQPIDLVFPVSLESVYGTTDNKTLEKSIMNLPRGSFVEFKRDVRIDLSVRADHVDGTSDF